MICVLSPAKTMIPAASLAALGTPTHFRSAPAFLEQSMELAKVMKTKTRPELGKLCDVSANLSGHVHDLYSQFSVLDHAMSSTPSSKKRLQSLLDDTSLCSEAALMFDGPAYRGLAADTLSADKYNRAQTHLRILCGFYGSLRPGDAIQEYRLCMGTKIALPSLSAPTAGDRYEHRDLYSFWGSSIADGISRDLRTQLAELNHPPKVEKGAVRATGSKRSLLINVASQEYFKAIQQHLPSDVFVLDCVFLDQGMIKSAFAKRARGLMARFACTEAAVRSFEDREKLKAFTSEGYKFSAAKSTDSVYVFERSAADAAAATAATAAALKAKKGKAIATAAATVESGASSNGAVQVKAQKVKSGASSTANRATTRRTSAPVSARKKAAPEEKEEPAGQKQNRDGNSSSDRNTSSGPRKKQRRQ